MPVSSQKTNNFAVQVKDLTVAFGDNIVLDDISFEIKRGDIAAIIGPNGSGKTTLLRAILGLTKPQAGEVRLLGQPLHHVQKAIGYVPQRFEFDKTFPITVKEFLQLALHKDGDKKHINTPVKEVGLKNDVLKKQLGTLSGGQLQRILIAQAILNDPSILVLDEPSTGIDIVGEAAFYDVIRHVNEEHHTTVVLVSHDVSMVSKSVDQVICLNKRLMCAGPPEEALTEKTLDQVFGDRHMFEHEHSGHLHEHKKKKR